MRRKYKNAVFRILQESRLGIDSFTVEEEEVSNLPAINIYYNGTPFIFTIRNSPDDFDLFDYQFVKYNPQYNLTEFYPQQDWTSFESVMAAFKGWLNNHICEYLEDRVEPDLWEEYRNGNKSMNIGTIDFEDKTSFSVEEKLQVRLSINELKLLIEKNIKLSDDERKLVHERLDYLIEASDRLNKFDWKSISVSTLIGIVTTLSLDTEKGRVLFNLFKKVFSIVPLLSEY